MTVAAGRTVVPTIPDMPDYRCDLYRELYAWLEAHGVGPGSIGPEMAIYHASEFVERSIDMEAAVVVDPPQQAAPSGAQTVVRELPAAEVASVVHRGSPWEIPDAISALYAWIGENGYSATGPYREIHLYWHENDLAEKPGGLDSIVVEMQLPVGKS